MNDIYLPMVGIIFILVWLRYKTNNGMWNIIAGVMSLGITLLLVQHSHDFMLAVGAGLMSGYLFYDGLLK